MFNGLSNVLNKPIFNALYSRVFKESVLDDLNYPMEGVYLDVDVNALEEAKTRCLMMNTNMTVDYFTVTLSGDVIVDLNILIKYAKYKGLDELIIPDGITYLYFEPGYLSYLGKIIFPKTLKVLSPLLLNKFDNMSFDYGSITMNYSTLCEFGILDFSKCFEIDTILSNAFDNVMVNEIILPESINKIYCEFNTNYIKKVYINSVCDVLKYITPNLIIKDNRVKNFIKDSDESIIPESLKNDIIIVDGGVLKGNLKDLNIIYYPLDYHLMIENIRKLLENYNGDMQRLSEELREIFVCLIHSVSLINIKNSKLLPLFYELKLTNNFVTMLLFIIILCNYNDSFNSLRESTKLTDILYLILFGTNSAEIPSKIFYIYNNALSIDEYPVRTRDYSVKYSDDKFKVFIDSSMDNVIFE